MLGTVWFAGTQLSSPYTGVYCWFTNLSKSDRNFRQSSLPYFKWSLALYQYFKGFSKIMWRSQTKSLLMAVAISNVKFWWLIVTLVLKFFDVAATLVRISYALINLSAKLINSLSDDQQQMINCTRKEWRLYFPYTKDQLTENRYSVLLPS